MFEMPVTEPAGQHEIASYDVSEDGETWRPYDPARDRHTALHKRIVFATSDE